MWKRDLVVGTPDLKRPKAQLDIRPHRHQTYQQVAGLVSTIDQYFQSPLHHFGADEVAYIWHSEEDNKLFNANVQDDNRLFEGFLRWLKSLCPTKSLILWDDPLTDEGKDVNLSKDWIIQTWHDDVTQNVLDKGHRVIVSESSTFYIGNATQERISSFEFPSEANVLGFELVWFTSEGDDPYGFNESWVMDPIKAASQIRRSQ